MTRVKTMSSAEFKQRLQPFLDGLKDTDSVAFGNGDLSWYRPKSRSPRTGPQTYHIEFNEAYTVVADPDNTGG